MKSHTAPQENQRRDARSTVTTRHERGAVSILTTLVAVILLGSLGFAVDLGNAMQMQRKAQNAADSAAFAGIAEYEQQLDYEMSVSEDGVLDADGAAPVHRAV